MEIPQIAIDLAKHFEGLSLKPYLCPAGFWTIGYGRLCKRDHIPVTKNQAEEYLIEDLQISLKAVIHICPVLLYESQERLGVIIDFTFNLGSGRLKSSTLRKRINEKRFSLVPAELQKWVYGGGRKLSGLVLRRHMESLYFT